MTADFREETIDVKHIAEDLFACRFFIDPFFTYLERSNVSTKTKRLSLKFIFWQCLSKIITNLFFFFFFNYMICMKTLGQHVEWKINQIPTLLIRALAPLPVLTSCCVQEPLPFAGRRSLRLTTRAPRRTPSTQSQGCQQRSARCSPTQPSSFSTSRPHQRDSWSRALPRSCRNSLKINLESIRHRQHW